MFDDALDECKVNDQSYNLYNIIVKGNVVAGWVGFEYVIAQTISRFKTFSYCSLGIVAGLILRTTVQVEYI